MNVMFLTQDREYHCPIGIMQISAMARQRGDETSLGILSKEDAFARVQEVRPDVIAYSGSTGEHKYYIDFNRRLRDSFPDLFTVMGGPHATFFPEILDEARLNAVCIGEGDYAFVDLLNRVEAGESVNGIPNIVSEENRSPGLRSLVQDLDALPFPDRELFYEREEDGQRVLTENGKSKLKNFMIGRGCPYQCSYCFNKSFSGLYKGQRYIRRHSVDYVLEEIAKTRERYPLGFVKFYDDIFTFQADEWLEEFAEKYPKQIGLPFYCLTRADLLTPDMARLLRDSGCQTVQMAVESTNDRIRNGLLRRSMSKEEMAAAFKLCRDNGLTIVTNYILGLPTSTIQDDIDAVSFSIANGIQVTEFPIFQPYPRTPLGDMCVREGWFDGDFDKMHMSYNNRSPLTCFTEEQKDIQANINRLGALAISSATQFPSMTDLIMRHLIYQLPNDFFAEVYSRHKFELYSKLVYPMQETAEELERARQETMRLETFKRTSEKK